MSFLVALPSEQYRADALDALRITSDFSLDNARAMMWMSQLAYETGDAPPDTKKVSDILGRWNLRMLDCIGNEPGTSLPLQTACAVVAAGRGATIVAFAGTDPLKLHDWITDFDALKSPDGSQTGFQIAVDGIWDRIKAAVPKGQPDDNALFFTGHSLGGVLAVIAADKAQRELATRATAVYTFGGPRPGDEKFATDYDLTLRDRIYRLVHGNDIVATVGPSEIGFRHVGQMLACPSGGTFSANGLLPSDNDKPDFVRSFFESQVNTLRMWAHGHLITPLAPGWFGLFLGILPLQIRDHVPPNYFRALGQ